MVIGFPHYFPTMSIIILTTSQRGGFSGSIPDGTLRLVLGCFLSGLFPIWVCLKINYLQIHWLIIIFPHLPMVSSEFSHIYLPTKMAILWVTLW